MEKFNLLIIDDDVNLIKPLEQLLKDDYTILTANDLKRGREILKNTYIDIVILDINLPDGSGINFLDDIMNLYDEIIVIMSTANDNVRAAIECMKKGAADYLVKPYNIDELKIILNNSLKNRELKLRVEQLEYEVEKWHPNFEIIGESAQIKYVLEKIRNIYDKDVTVLIRGASGTGKELIARDIHNNSFRKNRPFLAVNCAAIPDTLIENELFGHIKGAYTGAHNFQRGKFEAAADGDIFLDEIGSLSAQAQLKLLRVIQEKKITRIGDTKEIIFRGRIIAATSINLEEAVKKGTFREDLYFRINVFPVYLPRLNERKEDIKLLADFFINKCNAKYGLNIQGLTDELIRIFENYEWRGNIRELQNVIEQLALLTDSSLISADDLKTNGKLFARFYSETENNREIEKLEYAEKIHIEKALAFYKFNITRTAAALDITRKTLAKKIKEYKIKKN